MSSRKPSSSAKAVENPLIKDGAEIADYFKDDSYINLGEVFKDVQIKSPIWEKLNLRFAHLKETQSGKVDLGRVLELTINTALDYNGSFAEWCKKKETSRSSASPKPSDNKSTKKAGAGGGLALDEEESDTLINNIGAGTGAANGSGAAAKSV